MYTNVNKHPFQSNWLLDSSFRRRTRKWLKIFSYFFYEWAIIYDSWIWRIRLLVRMSFQSSPLNNSFGHVFDKNFTLEFCNFKLLTDITGRLMGQNLCDFFLSSSGKPKMIDCIFLSNSSVTKVRISSRIESLKPQNQSQFRLKNHYGITWST